MTEFLSQVAVEAVLKEAYRVPAITAYNRLEPRARTLDFTRSLRAEVRDGLWFLTRQWQLGELHAEDAASPIEARVATRSAPFDRVSLAGAPPVPYDEETPLDVVVESEGFPWSLTMRVEVAELFVGALSSADRDPVRAAARTAFPLQDEADWSLQPDTVALLRVARRRTFDGARIVTSHRAGTLATDLGVAPGVVDAAGDAVLAWGRRIYGPAFATTGTGPPAAWVPEALAYDVALATPATAAGDVATLVAPRFSGGRLDWDAFDAAEAGTQVATLPGAPPPEPDPDPLSFLPVAASFPGMPNPRFWEMEDRRINFGSLNAKTTDHLLLVFAEMGLIYGNDWFVLPMELPVNHVHEVRGLVVTDVFGDRTLVPAANDPVELTWQRWSMFAMTGESRDDWAGRFFWLPATLVHLDESEPLEEVLLARDEMANLVWGVETIVPGGTGQGTDTARLVPAPAPATSATEGVRYVLGTTVPENWVPFLPEHLPGSVTDIRFRRGAMPPQGEPPVEPRRRSALLSELPAPFYLAEEEVPVSGVRITRRARRTRWHDGRTFLWVGRVRETGRGAASSGLAFDQLVEHE